MIDPLASGRRLLAAALLGLVAVGTTACGGDDAHALASTRVVSDPAPPLVEGARGRAAFGAQQAHDHSGHDHSAHGPGDGHDHSAHGGVPAHGGSGSSGVAGIPGHPPVPGMGQPASGVGFGVPAMGGSVSPPPSGLAADLAWTVPDGWRRDVDRPMRVVTLRPEATPDVQAYVTVLPGHAGGARANIDRWFGQMGSAPLDIRAYEALPRLTILGVESVAAEIPGRFTGMQGEQIADALMVGVVCELPDRTVFVKLIGPRAEADEARKAFALFCNSLRFDRG